MQDIKFGRPKEDCFRKIMDDYRVYIMLPAGVSGGVLLLGFFCSIPICCGIPQNEGDAVAPKPK